MSDSVHAMDVAQFSTLRIVEENNIIIFKKLPEHQGHKRTIFFEFTTLWRYQNDCLLQMEMHSDVTRSAT